MEKSLNISNLPRLAQTVASADPVLASIYERLGTPPLWTRRPGLDALLHIILEQQVSLSSGRIAMQRLRGACGGRVSAKRICEIGPGKIQSLARLTRRKSEYVAAVATACRSGQLRLGSLASASDEQVCQRLMSVRGIGPWTAGIYLLNALARPDVLPVGDLALAVELGRLCGLNHRPDEAWIARRAVRWRPWRSVAVRMIWHSYLDRRGRSGEI